MIPLSRETSENIVTLLLVKGRLTNEQVDIVTKDESEALRTGVCWQAYLKKNIVLSRMWQTLFPSRMDYLV